MNFGNTHSQLTLRPNSQANDVKIVSGNTSVHLIDDVTQASDSKHDEGGSDVLVDCLRNYWKVRKRLLNYSQLKTLQAKGYVHIAELVKLTAKTKLVKSQEEPKVTADIFYADTRVGLCADSLSTLTKLLSDVSPTSSETSNDPSVQSKDDKDPYTNLLASLDESAFKQLPDAIVAADLVDDDIPSNQEYIYETTTQQQERYLREQTVDFDAFEEGLSPSSSDDLRDNVDDYIIPATSQPNEIVRQLIPDAVMQSNFIETLRNKLDESVKVAIKPYMEVQLHSADTSLQLFEGCDWSATRHRIEEEHNRIRKKLVKFRQLLASGQQADCTEEELSFDVYGAYNVGISQHVNGSDEILKAIDEELGDESEWQTLVTPTHSRRPSENTSTRQADFRKSLYRSKGPFVEITACGIKSTMQKFEEGEKSSDIKLSIKDVEILDRKQKLNWRKFMTSLDKDLRGNVRESESNMVELSLETLLTEGEEEVALHSHVLPLKLNMDQDALDFLKRFFAFKDDTDANDDVEKGPYIREC